MNEHREDRLCGDKRANADDKVSSLRSADNANADLDEKIKSVWSEIKVSDQLKSSTLSAIHAQSDKAKPSTGDEVLESAAISDTPRTGSLNGEDSSARGTNTNNVTFQRHGGRRDNTRRFRRTVSIAIAAVLALTALGVGGNAVYHTETAYANIISGYQITLSINRFGRVIDAVADTDDESIAESIESLSLISMSYEEAMAALTESNYLSGSVVDVEIGCNDAGQKQQLTDESIACLEKSGCSGQCNGKSYGSGSGTGAGAGVGSGNSTGSGTGNGDGSGYGVGDGSGAGSGVGSGDGSGSGTSSGHGSGNGTD